MKYQTIPIDKIRPDPNQPRKNFDEEALKEMTVSISNEGVINAIEVDKDMVIITGERRWRASKMAGLKEIPVKIIEKISPKERFIRQVQENIHQNTMSPLDTATSLEKIRTWVSSSTVELDRDKKHQADRYRKGILELHKLLGTPESTISRFLDLLGETGEMKKALQTQGFQMSKVEIVNNSPKKYQADLRHLVASQKDVTRDTVRNIASALKRAEKYEEDHLVKELLKENYEGLTSVEALHKINKIIPDEMSRVKEPADAMKFISEKAVELMELLDEHPLDSFDDFHRPMVVKDLRALGAYMGWYLSGKKEEMKKLKSGE